MTRASVSVARLACLALAALAFFGSLAAAAPQLRLRDARGRFLPKVSEEAAQRRAYEKFDARNRAAGAVVHGFDQADYVTAKSELQAERSAEIRAEKQRASQPGVKSWQLKHGVTVTHDVAADGARTTTVAGARRTTTRTTAAKQQAGEPMHAATTPAAP